MAGILYFLTKIPKNNVISIARRLHIEYNKKILATFITPSLNIMTPTHYPSDSSKYMVNISNRALLSLFNVPTRSFRTSIVLCEEQDVTIPEFPESVAEGDVRWNKNVGDSVVTDEVVCEIETDKTAIPVHSPGNGVIVARYAEDGGAVKAHQKIFRIKLGAAGAPAPKPAAQPSSKAAPPPPKATHTPVKAPLPAPKVAPPPAPKVAPPAPKVAPPPPSRPAPAPKPPPSIGTLMVKVPPQDPTQEISGTRTEYRVKMNRMRIRIAQRLKEAQNENAMLTTFNEIDMSFIISFRKAHQDAFTKKHGVKLGFMSTFIKACCCALHDQPVINAVIDGNEIVYRDYVDMSVAVATPKGLLVPVIRNVTSMNFADIEKAIISLGEKAKAGRIAVEDMDGGTFTISNGGVFGSLLGTPIINPPQSAILGMHATFERPVAIKGQVVIKPMMYVALTYDHRLIDGREAVLFLRKIKESVENPVRIVAGL